MENSDIFWMGLMTALQLCCPFLILLGLAGIGLLIFRQFFRKRSRREDLETELAQQWRDPYFDSRELEQDIEKEIEREKLLKRREELKRKYRQ